MKNLAHYITRAIDWLYGLLPLRRIMPLQTFRYAVCGGGNMVFGTLIYHLIYNALGFEVLHIWFFAVSAPIVTHCLVFPVTLGTGFYLNRNVAFKQSPLRTRTQFIRYTLSNIGSFGVSYLFLKLFVEGIGLYPTLGEACAGVMTAFAYSYPMQKYFSFRGSKKE